MSGYLDSALLLAATMSALTATRHRDFCRGDMCQLLRSGFVLASLIDAHFEGRIEIASTDEGSLPRAPLKGWRVLEEVSVGTDRYLLLCRGQQDRPTTGLSSLTTRESEAVRLASGGASNKEIAYEMNISASTVGVLLWRAVRKLNVSSRDELIRIVAERCLR